jgi:two-component system, NarL family, response regulator LiaR
MPVEDTSPQISPEPLNDSGAEGRRIAVLIVDDHFIVRQGLRTLLELHDDILVAAEAANGKAAVELTARLKPDVVLMDLVMPEMDGITATRQICDLGLNTKVIALTSFVEDEKVIPAIQAGATSFLLKDVSPVDLLEAIRAAYHGEARLHPAVMRMLMDQVSAQPAAPAPAAHDLTGREMEILRLVAEGLTNREIAAKLVISEKTVKTHISSLLGKLDLSDRTRLAIYAIKHRLAGE